jgi:hypothetical protein
MDDREFKEDIFHDLIPAVLENVPIHFITLQLNASKYAYNKTVEDILCQAIKIILELPHTLANKHVDGVEYMISVTAIFEKFVPILVHYIQSV